MSFASSLWSLLHRDVFDHDGGSHGCKDAKTDLSLLWIVDAGHRPYVSMGWTTRLVLVGLPGLDVPSGYEKAWKCAMRVGLAYQRRDPGRSHFELI